MEQVLLPPTPTCSEEFTNATQKLSAIIGNLDSSVLGLGNARVIAMRNRGATGRKQHHAHDQNPTKSIHHSGISVLGQRRDRAALRRDDAARDELIGNTRTN